MTKWKVINDKTAICLRCLVYIGNSIKNGVKNSIPRVPQVEILENMSYDDSNDEEIEENKTNRDVIDNEDS